MKVTKTPAYTIECDHEELMFLQLVLNKYIGSRHKELDHHRHLAEHMVSELYAAEVG